MVDINGDGKLDIYACHSGMLPSIKRTNELFINEGNDAMVFPSLVKKLVNMAWQIQGISTQSFFFDYDRDGDLDMLLLHHNPRNLAVLNPKLLPYYLNNLMLRSGLNYTE
jgi:hypothetical protein